MSTDSMTSHRMTRETAIARPKAGFIPGILPWIIAAAGLLIYLATLNHWVGWGNLPHVARVSGWTWHPQIFEPLYWLITSPFRWLPQQIIPISLNLLSVVFACLILALLARSVVLLPHDRTHEERQREQSPFSLLSTPTAWIPPVLAALICGLQLSFWENATIASGEMLNLLLFAYVIRCLLEFRIDARESWLSRAAFVYALGMTNNWAMIGFFPFFLMALIWIKGLSFFNVAFLRRMFLFGLAGLALYLLLPIVQSLSDSVTMPFWRALKTNLGSQLGIVGIYFKHSRQTLALLSLTSLVPIFVISIRWSSSFGDTSYLGAGLATLMFHVVHALFLVACIWVALDPPFSPRHVTFGPAFLTFYYLGALAIGYLAGYFLLVFRPKTDRVRRAPAYLSLVNKVAIVAIAVLLVGAPAALMVRNLPQIRLTNGRLLDDLGKLMMKGLPATATVVLADDPRRAWLGQAAGSRNRAGKNLLFLDTSSLEYPDYQRFLRKKLGTYWPIDVPKNYTQHLDRNTLSRLLLKLSETHLVYYLHPSFGYYFESFYAEPHGLSYKLIPYSTNSTAPVSFSKEIIAENEELWSSLDSSILQPLIQAISPVKRDPPLMELFARKAHLKPEPNTSALAVAAHYSRALNYWGAEQQKNGALDAAAAHFSRALELNPENVVARVNLECNKNLRAGSRSAVAISKTVEDSFGKYRNWNDVMNENGPFDEPNFCFEQGQVFIGVKLYRQARHQFERVTTLDPTHVRSRLWLAQLDILFQNPDDALQQVQAIHELEKSSGLVRTNQTELLFVEAGAHLMKKEPAAADLAVQNVLKTFPATNDDLFVTASQVFIKYGFYSNALQVIDRHLKVSPDYVPALINKGFVCLQLGQYAQAIPPLSHTLELQPTNSTALLDRAIAYLRDGQVDAAQGDYEALSNISTNSYQVFYGLAEIAYQKRNTNAAIRNYELYLTNAPVIPEERQVVTNRLAELKSAH